MESAKSGDSGEQTSTLHVAGEELVLSVTDFSEVTLEIVDSPSAEVGTKRTRSDSPLSGASDRAQPSGAENNDEGERQSHASARTTDAPAAATAAQAARAAPAQTQTVKLAPSELSSSSQVAPPTRSSPVSPSARVAVKMPRKTPVVTPSSSSNGSPPVGRSPALLHPPQSSRAFPADPKHTARVQRWADLLLPAMTLERDTHGEAVAKDIAVRIASAIPGDKQEAKDTFLMLLVNLKDPKNGVLRRRVLSGELPVEVLVSMGEHDLINPERRRTLDAEFEERAKDTNLTEIRKASMTSSTLFTCPYCRAKDCTWTQKQTRSADEPMTIFCSCNKCSHVWKKY